jgi:single-strand DNA-binding protein
MSDFNKVVLSGRVTRDAEIKFLSSGNAVCDFGFASNRKFGEKEETTYVDCTIFGKKAESLNQYMVKGKNLILEGRLRLETWEKDGQKRSKLSVVVEDVTFLSSGERKEQSETEVRETKTSYSPNIDLEQSVPF